MADDRIDGDDLALTHEFLAMMLCVRRPGVTVAIQELERVGLIARKRGRIVIIDRDGAHEIGEWRLISLPTANSSQSDLNVVENCAPRAGVGLGASAELRALLAVTDPAPAARRKERSGPAYFLRKASRRTICAPPLSCFGLSSADLARG